METTKKGAKIMKNTTRKEIMDQIYSPAANSFDPHNILEESSQKDPCVACGVPTLYDRDTHIDHRYCYVEGAGQLCMDCYTKLYDENRARDKTRL